MMIKHSSLTDLLKLIVQHKEQLKKVQKDSGALTLVDLAVVFTSSNDPFAASFTFVFGGMKGSRDDQYAAMLKSLTKKGHVSLVDSLKKRKNRPCIDLQESTWMLKQERDRDYGYKDYKMYKNNPCFSGRAPSVAIDWTILEKLVSDESTSKESAATLTNDKSIIVEHPQMLDIDLTKIQDERNKRITEITQRQGQPEFRRSLLEAYGNKWIMQQFFCKKVCGSS